MPRPPQPIQHFLESYDPNTAQAHIDTGEQERQEFLKLFPLSNWSTMTLEQYALGQSDSSNTYCRWLEFKALHLGSMRGGSAVKHLIYKYKNKTGWYFPSEYTDEQQAWQVIRNAFIQMFELAQAGKWEQIDEIRPLLSARMLRLKSLHIYFPESILPISSTDHIRHFLARLGVFAEEMQHWDAVRLNRGLLTALQQIPDLKDWKTGQLGRLIYAWEDPRQSRRIFKIAPGENAKYWDDCLANGYICVGWDEVGSLLEYENKDAFKTRFTELFTAEYKGHRPQITRKANEVWTLVELEPGDIVIANQGLSNILAVGEVIEPGYQWMPERPNYKHTVSVKWDTSYEQEIAPQQQWVFTTVNSVQTELFQQIMNRKGGRRGEIAPETVDPLFLKIADALERKGQAILYGPPGTGKTYYARRFAVWWLSNALNAHHAGLVLQDPKMFAVEERKLSTSTMARRVWWFVANPTEWSWDKLFTEKKVTFRYARLQRNYSLVKPDDLVVGYQSRPDKKVMAFAKVTKGFDADHPDKGIELQPLKVIKDGPTYEDLQKDLVMQSSEPMRNHCRGTLFALTPEEAQYILILLAEDDPEISEYITSGEGIGPLTWVTFHPSYSYEDFVEGFRPVDSVGGGLVLRLVDGIFKSICLEARSNPKQRFIVVIDEINRANLAKVFGELITLFEKDKRGLEIKLPQSKDPFTVPSNVYLLGTMNTADRSIKLLDSALRRRFAFIELMPDLDLLSGVKVNNLELDTFLYILNSHIAETEGREKQIGHAYLLAQGKPVTEPTEFARRFRQEILPLLQEYCYDDYNALASYIGNKLVDGKSQSLDHEILYDDDALIDALAEWTLKE